MGVVLNPIDGKFDVINNKASKIKVVDAGGYYTGTEVEAALQEVGEDVVLKLDKFVVDTKANILASAPSGVAFAFASDNQRLYLFDGSEWSAGSLKLYPDSANPDMGYKQDSTKDGYYATFITGKKLYNIVLQGYVGTPVNGAIRINVQEAPDTLEIYMRDEGWYTLIYDMTTSEGDFRHTPIAEPIYIWRGDSVLVGLNGQPVVQEYVTSMGAYPPFPILDGGVF